MNIYRFIVFPSGASPSTEEMAAFRGYVDLLDRHVAYGRHRADGGLAIACEAEPFERLRGLDPAFDDLLIKWQARGGKVVERLAFSKDAEIWKKRGLATDPTKARPAKRPDRQRHYPSPAPPDEFERTKLKNDAREAEGRSRLAVARQAHQGQRYARLASWLPYLLWLVGGIATLSAGAYLSHRLLNTRGETRSETIQRLSTDAMDQPLKAHNAAGERLPSTEDRD